MRLLVPVLALLLLDRPGVAQAPQADGTLQVGIPASKLYKEGRDVVLNRAVLRRVRYAPLKRDHRTYYLKLELWLTNTDIDACTQPELLDISDFPLSSDTSFVLVWQGLDWSSKAENVPQSFMGLTVFADSWRVSRNKPMVLLWSTSRLSQILDLFRPEPVNLAGIIEQRYQDLNILPGKDGTIPDTLTFVWVLNHSKWTMFHQEAKDGRQDQNSWNDVKVSQGAPVPVIEFTGGVRSGGIKGTLPPMHLCPGIVEDRRHGWYDKPAKRPKP